MGAPVKDSWVSTEYGLLGLSWSCGATAADPRGRHTGRDYHAPESTPVLATKAGEVVDDNWGGAFGKQVIIETGAIRHLYAHLSRVDVAVGDSVLEGEQVGLSGDTGNAPGGAHLHYEERTSPYHPHCAHDRRPEFDEEPETDMTPDEHNMLVEIRNKLRRLDRIQNMLHADATLTIDEVLAWNYKRIARLQDQAIPKILDVLADITDLVSSAQPIADERRRLLNVKIGELISLRDEIAAEQPPP